MRSALLLRFQRVLYRLANVLSGGRVIPEFANPLRDQDSQKKQEELDERRLHPRPVPLNQELECGGFVHHGLDGLSRVRFAGGSAAQNRLEAEHPRMGETRPGQNLDGVSDDVERPVRKLGPGSTAGAVLLHVLERGAAEFLDRKGRGEDETATGTEGREPHALTVSDAAAFAIGLAIGVVA